MLINTPKSTGVSKVPLCKEEHTMRELLYDAWEYAGKVVDQIYNELSKEELRELDKILDKIDLKGISFK